MEQFTDRVNAVFGTQHKPQHTKLAWKLIILQDKHFLERFMNRSFTMGPSDNLVLNMDMGRSRPY